MAAIARKGPTVARILLGVVFTVFGLNFFLAFLPAPAPPTGQAGVFLAGLVASGFIMPIVKVVEVGAGLLLLGNRQVPLALTVLAPIVVGVVGYHASLDPAGLPIALAILGLELYLAWSYRAAFAPMLVTRASATPR